MKAIFNFSLLGVCTLLLSSCWNKWDKNKEGQSDPQKEAATPEAPAEISTPEGEVKKSLEHYQEQIDLYTEILNGSLVGEEASTKLTALNQKEEEIREKIKVLRKEMSSEEFEALLVKIKYTDQRDKLTSARASVLMKLNSSENATEEIRKLIKFLR